MTEYHPGARLARALTATGAIQDPAWHRAVLAVPRTLFIPHRVWVSSRDHPGWYRPVTSDDPDYQRWVDEDWALMTQIDDGHPCGEGEWGRLPTSSISQPSLVVEMLQTLDVTEGMRVLEIGTGTGYNTALLCERLGDENVVSIEVDPDVAAQARANLHSLGYKPTLLVSDGTAGAPEQAPFDRVLATVAAHTVPPAWITQTRLGGVIVTPWSTWFSSGVLLRLEVDHGAARGRIVGDAPFMMLRDQRSTFRPWHEYVDDHDPRAVTGETTTNPRCIADRDDGWRLTVGHLVEGVDFVSYEAKDDSGEASVYVYDRGRQTGSWALGEYTPAGEVYEAVTCGPRDLWAEIGAARRAWEAAGRPGRDRLGLTITPDGQHSLWVDTPEQVLSGD
ncbi:methyltransferase domain-containing protein [Salinactinospora qingdaonensis]|uniref:Protein-L-isoaspartate O-methyltransferase n=1 Tax=Salinactinospora qingdaonensis TaxID=702744 RepID=A0ABP7F8N6_9ACTN